MKYILFSVMLCALCIHSHAQVRNSSVANEVFYEVNVRQFSEEGKLKNVTASLPTIKSLGVTTIWLMPIYPIGVKNRKGKLGSYYSIKAYTDVNPEFGTVEDFRMLVDSAHKLGMKVIIDWVANHTAWDHFWVTKYPEYYEKDPKTGKLKSPFDWTDVVELNYNNEAMSAAMIENMRFWVENFKIDGFRADVADLVPLSFWEKARTSIDPLNKQIWLGECEKPEYFKVFDLQYAWKFLHLMEDVAANKANQDSAAAIIAYYNNLAQQGKYHMYFTSNHDENSWNGTDYERYGAAHNAFATLCSKMPGAFLIYNGQEYGLNKRLKFFEKDTIVPQNRNQFILFQNLANNVKARKENATAIELLKTKQKNTLVLTFTSPKVRNGPAEAVAAIWADKNAVSDEKRKREREVEFEVEEGEKNIFDFVTQPEDILVQKQLLGNPVKVNSLMWYTK